MQRKRYTPEYKAKIVLEALREQRTLNELAREYGPHPVQISQWKKQALDALPELFGDRKSARSHAEEEEIKARLYQQIGQLQVEVDWLKKKSRALAPEMRRLLVDRQDPALSIVKQCALLGVPRSSIYAMHLDACVESPENLQIMRAIDELYTKMPFLGSRRMAVWLCEQGYDVNRKRIQRLMRRMGLVAIYPGPNLSRRNQQHRVYPYLLRGLAITRPNQVWSIDITYIRMATGFLYLVAIIDWYSRYVLAWQLSNTLDEAFCVEALVRALRTAPAAPEIFNSDQGCQFTSDAFTGRLKAEGIQISMDGKGRALDNIFIERLWRTVKYEEVYLKDYQTASQARDNLDAYFGFYNHERFHQALGYQTPAAIYAGQAELSTTVDSPPPGPPTPDYHDGSLQSYPQRDAVALA